MIERTLHDGADLLVVGTVRGLVAEVPPLLERVGAFRPDLVGVGVSSEEARGLREHFIGTAAEPVVPLAGSELAEIRALSRFGEIRVPNPSFVELFRWGADAGFPVEPVDPPDDSYAALFTDHIGYLELVRRTLRERRLSREPPSARTADELAVSWAARMTPGGGSRRFVEAREAAVVESVRRLASGRSRVAVVVDRERFDPLLAAFAARG